MHGEVGDEERKEVFEGEMKRLKRLPGHCQYRLNWEGRSSRLPTRSEVAPQDELSDENDIQDEGVDGDVVGLWSPCQVNGNDDQNFVRRRASSQVSGMGLDTVRSMGEGIFFMGRG